MRVASLISLFEFALDSVAVDRRPASSPAVALLPLQQSRSLHSPRHTIVRRFGDDPGETAIASVEKSGQKATGVASAARRIEGRDRRRLGGGGGDPLAPPGDSAGPARDAQALHRVSAQLDLGPPFPCCAGSSSSSTPAAGARRIGCSCSRSSSRDSAASSCSSRPSARRARSSPREQGDRANGRAGLPNKTIAAKLDQLVDSVHRSGGCSGEVRTCFTQALIARLLEESSCSTTDGSLPALGERRKYGITRDARSRRGSIRVTSG